MLGLTNHSRRDPPNARGVGPKCSGPSLHEHSRRVKNSAVSATAGVTPLGWEASVFRQRDAPQRPVQKKDMTRDCGCTLHLHHIVCSAHKYTCATACCDSFIHSFTYRHIAQRHGYARQT